MKIAILGAGAMGSIYGALLARNGNDIWLIDRWAEHMDAVRNSGLRVSGATGNWIAHPQATTTTAEVGPCDLVIVATKTRDLASALEVIDPLLDDDTAVLCVQNGLNAPRIAEEMVGRDRVLLGIAGGFGASIPAPGYVDHTGWEIVRVAARNSEKFALAQKVAEVWRDADFNAEAAPDADHMIWTKLVCNSAYSAVCCVTGLLIGEVAEDPHARQISAACAEEAWQVAQASGVKLDFDDPAEYVRAFGRKIPGARPSMLLDRLAGKPSEVDDINGSVVEEGKRLGVATPVNATLVNSIHAMETHDLRPSRQVKQPVFQG
ncbi:ketopantoate reductase family protein [Fodinicurvata sediminis]|uniref:ketopantoate reductase family protein n=1 Tax=Fodinicurvata sediminis TaxID=1121832 RepID=UPI0003B35715|nr:2-dehydropantoate 2-reductase [Fodinicurvata sediminis]